MLTSSHGVVVVTGRRNKYEGVVRVETIMEAIHGLREPTAGGGNGGRDGAGHSDSDPDGPA